MKAKLLIALIACMGATAVAAGAALVLPTAKQSQAVGGGFSLYQSGQGSPLFSATNIAPGWQQSACLTVGPDGLASDQLGLFGSASGGLASALQLTVARGGGPDTGAGHSCAGFAEVKQVYSGSLAAWPQESAAIVDANRLASGGRTNYRFTLSLSAGAPANARASSANVTLSFGASPAEPPPPRPECSDGIDNDGDGRIDEADGGCASGADGSEREDVRTVDDLVLCGRRAISLISATKVSRKVVLHGVVSKSYRGAPVRIYTDRRVTTTVRAEADGQFRAKVKSPSLRRYKKARYSASVGGVKSIKLKLPQSLESRTIRTVDSSKTIELRGKVFPPRGKRPQSVVIRRILCGRYQRVAAVKTKRNGSYRIRFAAPDAAAGLYRAETRVPARKGAKRLKKAYARAIAITLDERSG